MQQSNNKYQSLVKSIAKFENISHLLIVITLLIQFNQIFSRAKIGFGLTDEAYGLSNAVDRAKNGQTGSTALFADITSPVLALVNFNVYYFRLVGVVILGLLCVLLAGFNLFSKQEFHRKSKAFTVLLLSVMIFTIPMNFRYLLITPSYQWIVLVFSILSVLLTLVIIDLRSDKFVLSFLLSLSIFTVTLARPTSGIVIWLLVNIYLFFERDIKKNKRIYQINSFLIMVFVTYTILNWTTLKSFVFKYMNLKHVDPNGSNLINEILDVAYALVFIWSIFYIGRLIVKLFLLPYKLESHSKKIKSFIVILFLSVYPIWHIAFVFRDLSHVLLSSYAFLLGVLVIINNQSALNFRMLLLSSAPVLTQFGSNTSASYLISPFLISLTIYSIFSSNEIEGARLVPETSRRENIQNGIKALLCLSLMLLVLSQSKFSYETDLPGKNLVKDPVSSLYYSSQKLERIQEFRRDAKVSGEFSGQRILDLSFWHPGIISYLGGLQFPFGLDNKAFRDTMDFQVRTTVNQVRDYEFNSSLSVIVETSQVAPTKRCSKLIEYIEDESLKRLLIENEFNPELYNLSVYVSDKVDITLFPKNVAYLVPCQSQS